jgi:single-strand DNA-binding protein
MAKGTVNKVILIGRLGANPEIKYMPSGRAVSTFSVATNDGYKDKQTGQFIESTEWHRINVFGQQAETLGSYAKKGQLLYVEGKIRTNKWQDKNGQDRYTTEIVALQTQMISNTNNSGMTNEHEKELKVENTGRQNKEKDSSIDDYLVGQKEEIKEDDIDKIDKIEDFGDDDLPF